MSIEKITNADLDGVGVVGLEDSPGLSCKDMQAKFEETSRSVIIPKINSLIEDHNKIEKDLSDLALEAGQVKPSQMEYWDAKLDPAPESYRLLTKCVVVGGSLGWFKVGEVELNAEIGHYIAILSVQCGYTQPTISATRGGILAVQLQLNAEGTALSADASRIFWLTDDRSRGNVPFMAVFDSQSGTVRLYAKTASVSERVRVSVMTEGNADGYANLMATANNSVAELTEPVGISVSFPNRQTFANGDSLALLAGDAEYRAVGEIATLTVTYPEGEFEAWIKFATPAEGTVTIILPTSMYIGEAPVFANGEVWELSIKDGVVVAVKCE